MKITITNKQTGERISIARNVAVIHPAWVHEQLGTESEADLQTCLDQFSLSDYYDGETHKGADEYGVELIADEADWSYRISDGNATEYSASLEDAESIVEDWYDYLANDGKLDSVPSPDLDSSSLDALNASIGRWEEQIAEACGRKAFAGHGNYYVSAASEMGLRLNVEKTL